MADSIHCAVCGREFRQISYAHLRRHSMTLAEYRARYPDQPICGDSLRSLKAASINRVKRTPAVRALSSERMRQRNADPVFSAKMRVTASKTITRLNQDPEFAKRHKHKQRVLMTKLNNDPAGAAKLRAARVASGRKSMTALHRDPVFAAAHALRTSKRNATLWDTRWQREFREYLESQLVAYTFNHYLPGLRHGYDFYLPAYNLIVELDGCYFHQCKRCLSAKKISRTSWRFENWKKDRQHTRHAQKQGYNILRVAEHDWQGPAALLESINNTYGD